MSLKAFSQVAGIIFLLMAIGHLARLFLKFQVVAGSHLIPLWASMVGVLVAGYLAYEGLRPRKTLP